MQWLRALAGGITAATMHNVRAWWRRSVAAMALMVFLGLTALGCLAFVSVGVYDSLREILPAWQAGLIVGGGLVAIALLVTLIVVLVILKWSKKAGRAEKKPPPVQEQLDDIAHLGETIGASLGKGVRTTDVMIAALVAGTVLGASPALRDRLFRRRRCSHDRPSSRSNRCHNER
jgi:hypothetical protein